MTKQELKQILEDHKNWLNNNQGRRADLRGANLSGTNLREADLRWADLSEADLREVDLRWADLRWADLSEADLSEAKLRWADLRGADLREADLLTFQYQKDQAYCTGKMLTIGCLTKSLDEWAKEYKELGKEYKYTDIQIEMYGQFINMCKQCLKNTIEVNYE